ncbi:MAG: tetracycline resistance MFS efflux pump, partial [Rhodanobacter sp.]
IAPTASFHMPGAAFVLSALLMLIGLVIAVRVTRQRSTTTIVPITPAALPDNPPTLAAVNAFEQLHHAPEEHP